MFSFIAFILKLLFGAILGGALVYHPGKIKDEHRILYSSMISLIAVALVGIARIYPANAVGFVTGAAIFTVIVAVVVLTKDLDFDSRLTYILSATIGLICGSGFVLYAIIFTAVIYIILHQGHKFLSSSEERTVDEIEEKVEKVEK